jgi:hypothetical protein
VCADDVNRAVRWLWNWMGLPAGMYYILSAPLARAETTIATSDFAGILEEAQQD